jgi:hypothetical protein
MANLGTYTAKNEYFTLPNLAFGLRLDKNLNTNSGKFSVAGNGYNGLFYRCAVTSLTLLISVNRSIACKDSS